MKYKFSDVSHHRGQLNHQLFASDGHRIAIVKASDNYHMPDINGLFDFSADRHHDPRMVENYTGFRSVGLLVLLYHFTRFDRPFGTKSQIVQANLTNFQNSVAMLPEQHLKEVTWAALDIEQKTNQLLAAGLNKADVSAMTKDIVALFLEHYKVLFYSGSWWTNTWLTSEVTQFLAELVPYWEAEYVALDENYFPLKKAYIPTVPTNFQREFSTNALDVNGKLFAWQHTNVGRITGSTNRFDLNVTSMPKEEMYKLFTQDGAVDPPPPPPPVGDCKDEQVAVLNQVRDNIDEIEAQL